MKKIGVDYKKTALIQTESNRRMMQTLIWEIKKRAERIVLLGTAMPGTANSKWLQTSLAIALAAISATAALSVCVLRKKSRLLSVRVRELEISLKESLEKCAAERHGRIRAQQNLRKTLVGQNMDEPNARLYPMAPIATVQSCFSTRNGTPRQPLLVPLARACIMLDSAHAPPEALEGLADYSHCWVLYVFHLNTDLEKLWKEPSRSKFKAKVRVPRLKGGKIGALATRSPHRPCPIGLTVAKVEAVHGRMILLSGVDLVDGTPVLDIKPYLPYSDNVEGATVPKWLMEDNSLTVASINFSPDFLSMLADVWAKSQKHSLYASPVEFQSLIKQVLSWDIRSVSQRNHPHDSPLKIETCKGEDLAVDSVDGDGTDSTESNKAFHGRKNDSLDITYHLILEGVDISYRIDKESHVIVEKATPSSHSGNDGGSRCNYMAWADIVGNK